ncbi:MAG: hypothetical protein IJV33_07405 [Bacteroidaceae bacterium]|nr:hypothetical protein [Bacteroidaceae bacterium]
MKKLLYLSVVLLLLLSACADDKGVLEVLDRAESLMEEHPDSSYSLLVECDSLIPQQSRRTRMHHLMLVAEAANKLYRRCPPTPSSWRRSIIMTITALPISNSRLTTSSAASTVT